jgi:ABC-type lipoprotein release transport system permease subunit
VQARGYQANPDVANALADPDAALAALAELDGLAASPRLRVDGLVQAARKSVRVLVTGVVPDAEARVSIVSRTLTEGSFLALPPSGRIPRIVMGARLAEDLRVRLGDKVVLRVPGEAGLGAFRIGGLFRTPSATFDKVAVFVRIGDARQLLGLPDAVTEVAVSLEHPERVDAVVAALAARLGSGVEVLSWQTRAPRLAAMLSLMRQMGWVFYGAVFVAMAFGIANTMLMAVYERLREFGVMRSLGLSRGRLMALIVLESISLTIAGTLLGLSAAFGVIALLGDGIDLSAFADALEGYGIGAVVQPRAGWNDVVSPLWLALATGSLAAVWPGVRVLRMKPAEALRRI